MQYILRSAKNTAIFFAFFCALQNVSQIFALIFAVFFALCKKYRNFFRFFFALCKMYRKYLQYFLRRANNTVKICSKKFICGIIWVAKKKRNFLRNHLCITDKKYRNYLRKCTPCKKIPQIYPTNIAPYSKYNCPVHIVYLIATAQYED